MEIIASNFVLIFTLIIVIVSCTIGPSIYRKFFDKNEE